MIDNHMTVHCTEGEALLRLVESINQGNYGGNRIVLADQQLEDLKKMGIRFLNSPGFCVEVKKV
jgi:hypothetical protein